MIWYVEDQPTDGEWEVEGGIEDLLRHVVQVVPSVVGPQARVEGRGNIACPQ